VSLFDFIEYSLFKGIIAVPERLL